MSNYSELEVGKMYLIKEEEDGEIILVQPLMLTNRCLLLMADDGEDEVTFWKEKDADLFEIVDELDDEQQVVYESLFEEEEFDENEI